MADLCGNDQLVPPGAVNRTTRAVGVCDTARGGKPHKMAGRTRHALCARAARAIAGPTYWATSADQDSTTRSRPVRLAA